MGIVKTAFRMLSNNGEWWRFLANLASITGLLTVTYALYSNFRLFVTQKLVEIGLASVALSISLGSIYYVYSRLRKSFQSRNYPSDYTILSYRKRLVYAVRLAYVDGSYFMNLVWLKATRAFLTFSTAAILATMHNLSLHIHNNFVDAFGIRVFTYSVLDFFVLASIATLAITTALNAYETHVLAAGVCRLRINRYNSVRRRARK